MRYDRYTVAREGLVECAEAELIEIAKLYPELELKLKAKPKQEPFDGYGLIQAAKWAVYCLAAIECDGVQADIAMRLGVSPRNANHYAKELRKSYGVKPAR
ncbi:MAG: hypothetical protein GY722_21770 [bacterium]|nr:hypothetical protein [bacterium]